MKTKIAEKGLFITIFWVPLINIAMYVGLLVSLVGCSGRIYPTKEKNALDWAIIIFTAVVFLSVLTSVNKILSIYGFIAFIAYPIAYFVFSKNITEENLLKIIKLIVFSTTVVLIVAVVQSFVPVSLMAKNKGFFVGLLGWSPDLPVWHGGRVVSTLGNPNVLGAYLVLILPILGCLFFHKPSCKTGAIFIAGITCLFFTYSRSAWLGFLAGFLVVSLIARKRFLVLIGLFFLISLFMIPVLSNRLKSFSDFSTYGRLFVWQESFNIIRQHPLTGTGINTFYAVCPTFHLGSFSEKLSHAHNAFLHLGAETGLPGMAVFGILIFLFFKLSLNVYKKYRLRDNKILFQWIVLGIIGGVSGFMVQNFIDYFFSRGQIGVLFWSMMGIVKGLDRLGSA